MGNPDKTTEILTANDEERYFEIGKAPNKEGKISREIWNYLLEFYEKKLKSQNPAGDTQITLQNSKINQIEDRDITQDILSIIKKYLQEKGQSLDDVVDGRLLQDKLILKTTSGDEVVIDLSAKTLEKIIIERESKDQRNSLQENMGKVALIAGGLGLVFYDVIKDGVLRVKSISLTVEGKKILIDVNKNFTSLLGFESEMFAIIEKKGLRFNTRFLAFEWTSSIDKITLGDIDSVQRYSYEQYQKDMKRVGQNEILSEVEFEKNKTTFLAELQKVHTQYTVDSKEVSFGKYFTQHIGEKIIRGGQYGLGVFLFPIFFKHMHQEDQDFASVLKTANEIGAFSTGAYAGKLIAQKVPNPVGKGICMIIFPLIAGGAAIAGTHYVGERFDIDWWYRENMPESEDWFQKTLGVDDSKSIMLHVFSGGVLNDVVDSINIDTWFYNTSIDFAESPRVYLSQRLNTKDLRNQRVDDFKSSYMEFLDSFYTKGGVFERLKMVKSNIERIKNAPPNAVFLHGKEAAIKEEEHIYEYWKTQLIQKLAKSVNPFGNPVQKEAHLAVINLITYHFESIVSGKISKESLVSMIQHYIDKLKITPEYLSKLGEKLDGQGGEKYRIEKAINGENVEDFKQEDLTFISSLSEEKRTFIKKVFERLVSKKQILNVLPGGKSLSNDILQRGLADGSILPIREGKTVRYISKEQSLWKELMQDKKFYVFFMRILNYKRENEFLSNMSQYGSAEKWGDSFDQFLKKYDIDNLWGAEKPFWYREK